MKKNIFIFIYILSVILSPAHVAAEALPNSTTSTPSILAEAAILIDAKTGEILYEKNSKQQMYPASITKLMTMLLALEHGQMDDKITFSHDAIYSIEQGSAHIAIQEGETLTLEQCLYGIILRSANEVSNALAEYVDGSMEAFAEHMTARAKELGCLTTNFVNANGLYNENHYTTAYDMALIAKQLLTIDAYRNIMSITDYDIQPTNKQTEVRNLHGQHQMLNSNSTYYYEYATGGKTGFTSESLNTLVTYATKGDTELIAVVLKCNGAEHYVDTKALFEYGFENYKTVKLLSASDYTKQLPITETYKKETMTLDTISISPAEDIYKTVAAHADTSNIEVIVDIPEALEAPVAVNDVVGTLLVKLDGNAISTVDLLAQKAVDATSPEGLEAKDAAAQKALITKICKAIAFVILGFIVLICITRTIGRYQRQQRRKRRRQQRKSQSNRRNTW